MKDIIDALRRKRSEYDRARANATDDAESLRAALQDLSDVTEAQRAVQRVAASCQDAAHAKIARVVTKCLRAVFGQDAYEFKIAFDRKRGKTEARLLFVRDGKEMDPLSSSGGGVVEVAAFALRLARLVLSRPRRRFFLCLDEPFRCVSAEYRERVNELVQSLSRELGVQFLLVTHIDEFATGKVVRL